MILEIEHVVTFSHSFLNEDRGTLGSVLEDLLATFLLHLRSEADVVVQKLTILQKKVLKYEKCSFGYSPASPLRLQPPTFQSLVAMSWSFYADSDLECVVAGV